MNEVKQKTKKILRRFHLNSEWIIAFWIFGGIFLDISLRATRKSNFIITRQVVTARNETFYSTTSLYVATIRWFVVLDYSYSYEVEAERSDNSGVGCIVIRSDPHAHQGKVAMSMIYNDLIRYVYLRSVWERTQKSLLIMSGKQHFTIIKFPLSGARFEMRAIQSWKFTSATPATRHGCIIKRIRTYA